MQNETTTNKPAADVGKSACSAWLEREATKITLLQRIWYWVKYRRLWPQCDGSHMPYKHMSDEECKKTIGFPNNGNKQIFYCLRDKWHIGKCRDIHGCKW